MPHRLIVAILWFAAVWIGYEIVWSMTSVPRVVGPVLATAIAAFVMVDPLGVFFARNAPTLMPSDQQASALSSPN